MPEPDSAHGAQGQFATTHWSVVLAAGNSAAPNAQSALEHLCHAYWYPLYAFARRHGCGPEEAQDLTQGFFAHFLDLVWSPRRTRRPVVSVPFCWLRSSTSSRTNMSAPLPLSGVAASRSSPLINSIQRSATRWDPRADTAAPDAVFDQRWALQQVENALRRLRADYASAGRAPLFDLLKDYVWGDKNALTLAQIAAQLDLTEEAVKKAI